MEEMTKERLESYKSSLEEIAELRYKIRKNEEYDDNVGNSVINDYRKGYPMPQSVVGFDHLQYERKRARYTKRLNKLQQECERIEIFVENIHDGLTRRVCRMRYIEGMKQEDIAKKVHMSQSNISKKINRLFQQE